MNQTFPRRFGDYQLLFSCGSGAFGEVFVAEDLAGMRFALKTLPKSPAADRELAGLRRYRSLAQEHPNLIRIHHIGTTETQLYYTMDLADNLSENPEIYLPDTLENRLRRNGRLTPEQVLVLSSQLLAGLEFLTGNRLVHRDIKPANIIFIGGIARLSDIGLVSEIEKTVSLAGTVGFISPELLTGAGTAGVSSDIYSLGKVLYCALTGQPPHRYPIVPPDLPLATCRGFRPILTRACNPNPAARFDSPASFRRALPDQLPAGGKVSRLIDRVRLFSARHRNCGRKLALATGIVCLVLVVSTIFLMELHHSRKQLAEATRIRAQASADRLLARRPLLDRAFQLYAQNDREEWTREINRFLAECSAGRWKSAAEMADTLDTRLEKFAEAELRKLLASFGPPPARFEESWYNTRLAALVAFRETPLFDRLNEDAGKQLAGAIDRYRSTLNQFWRGPVSGTDWAFFETPDLTFNFVPPGGFEMGKTKKFTRIPYHFWIARAEVLNLTCSTYAGPPPSLNHDPLAPVERIVWNDMLALSRTLTENAQSAGLLPKGYIIRPPLEKEWEYAATGAWRATPEKQPTPQELEVCGWFSTNSGQQSSRVQQKEPDALGLFDMLGNVSEITIPEQHFFPNLMVERGGSFRNPPNDHLWRCEWLCNQTLYWCGFRLVVAPGSPEFFDRFWFSGDAQRLRAGENEFELFGGNLGCVDGETAEKICKLLGGHPATLSDPRVRRQIIEQQPLAACYPVLVGGRRGKDGVWRWFDNTPIAGLDWIGTNDSPERSFLCWENRRFSAVGKRKLPLFLCEWNPAELAHRGSRRLWEEPSELELKRFRCAGREFRLLAVPGRWYTLRRICELLGGRPAVLDTPELKQQLLAELARFPGRRIALGGFRKYDRWLWINDRVAAGKYEPLRSPGPTARNDNYLGVLNGRIGFDDSFHAVLCERTATP